MSRQAPVIRASEITGYAFCARAWWLGRVQGYRSSNVAAMRRGEAGHRAHGRGVVGVHRLQRLAVALLILAGILLIAGLFLTLRG